MKKTRILSLIILFQFTGIKASFTAISQSNFYSPGASVPTRTYHITKSGLYICNENISLTPTANDNHLIYIDCNDVILDLNNHFLKIDSADFSACGIFIMAGSRNIHIKNGTIIKTTDNGIQIKENCSDISIENIHFKNCKSNGILFSGTEDNPIENINVKDCTIFSVYNKNALDMTGITLNHVYHGELNNITTQVVVKNNEPVNSYGIKASNCHNIILDNCNANSHKSNMFAVGFYLENCNTCSFNSCNSKLHKTTDEYDATTYGFYTINSHNIHFNKCISLEHSAPYHVSGFFIQDSKGIQLNNCTANGNFVSETKAITNSYGFIVTGRSSCNNYFEKCHALGNTSGINTSSKGAGFSLSGVSNCYLSDCIATSNGQNNGLGIGIEITETTKNCIIKSSQIIGNSSTVSGNAYGIKDDSPEQNNLLINNFAFANKDSSNKPKNQNYATRYGSKKIVTTMQPNEFKSYFLNSIYNLSIEQPKNNFLDL